MRKPPSAVAPFVEAARSFVRRAVALELDGSEESLAYVDHYIETSRHDGPLGAEAIALVAPALGAYFGELAISKLGGQWLLNEDDEGADDPGTWQIELNVGPIRFYPVAIARTALVSDDIEGVDDAIHAAPAISSVLEDAMARVAPVEADYYYSLTGRLETLAWAVDVVTEATSRGLSRKSDLKN
jgi:hypothetical protein